MAPDEDSPVASNQNPLLTEQTLRCENGVCEPIMEGSISTQPSVEKVGKVLPVQRVREARGRRHPKPKLKPEPETCGIAQGSVPCEMRFWRMSEVTLETLEQMNLVDGMDP